MDELEAGCALGLLRVSLQQIEPGMPISFPQSKSIGALYDHDRFQSVVHQSLSAALHGAISAERTRELLDLTEFVTFAHRNRAASRSQLFQDLWVVYETHGQRGGYFVEFGACDGKFLSNSFLLESQYGWTGLLAEPNKSYHEALAKNRSAKIDHRCVLADRAEMQIFRATEEGEYSVLADYALNDDHGTTRRSAGFIEYPVEVVSLTTMLTEHHAPHRLDYLSIDTEGTELDIIRSFDFSLYDVRLITIEHNYTNSRAKIRRLLAGKGYARKFEGLSKWDDWYIKI